MKRGIQNFIAQEILDDIQREGCHIVPSPEDGRATVQRWDVEQGCSTHTDDPRLAGVWGLQVSGAYLTPWDGDYTATFWTRDQAVADRARIASEAIDAAHNRLIVAIHAG